MKHLVLNQSAQAEPAKFPIVMPDPFQSFVSVVLSQNGRQCSEQFRITALSRKLLSSNDIGCATRVGYGPVTAPVQGFSV